jgi:hypothetical protein
LVTLVDVRLESIKVFVPSPMAQDFFSTSFLFSHKIDIKLTTYKNDHNPSDITDNPDQQSRNNDRRGPVGSLPVLQLRFRRARLTL